MSELRFRGVMLTFAIVGLAGCPKKEPPVDTAPVVSGATAASSTMAARGAPPASASSQAPSAAHASFSGSYTAKVGAVEPPKNANEKTWIGDPGSVAVGKGAIDLVVSERGDTRGEAKGPLGEMTVSGTYDGKEVRASLIPKEPRSDSAMTGFMVLAAEGDALKGTLRASSKDAKIVREATVELAKK